MISVRTTLILALSILSSNAAIASQRIQLEDGRHVQLNDDFTWQYVQTEITPANKPSVVVAAPVITAKRGVTLTINSGKPSLQLSDSGVDIVLGSAKYENGKVIIPTAITNQSSQSIISIELNIELLNKNGQILAQQKNTIWQSIKRMADTYLRPKTAAEGKTIEIEAPKADSYQILVAVENLEAR